MSDFEKIKIYIPHDIATVLMNDAILFEVMKSDGMNINKNGFLVKLIKGFYESYVTEYHGRIAAVESELIKLKVNTEMIKTAAYSLVQVMNTSDRNKKKGIVLDTISLKPTKEIEGIVMNIESGLRTDETLSQFYCGLLSRYCEKPQYERERIIFKDSYEVLVEACKKQQQVSFSTIWNKRNLHEVIPYALVTSKEEMFNYLLCQEVNPNTGKVQPATYRLNRIHALSTCKTKKTIDQDIADLLNLMKQYAPQFVMREKENIVVRLTKKGEELYNRIYTGRPAVTSINKDDNGTNYVFKCSRDQAAFYFRRFGKEAVIIVPKELRCQMKVFYDDAAAEYWGRSANGNEN